jgi:hypothetical protein
MLTIAQLEKLMNAAAARNDHEDEQVFWRAICAQHAAQALVAEERYQRNILPDLEGK